ncbi:Ankyrin-2 (ANK-2) (Ankyrin-B) (Brain ankyrin) (Non-erythroid ankyrin) [Durusdinium trenchii]|uniref:Ankyrin-2 (ANK-2) (Ankyrin-B) (Brain ankyrin) (Non-erythroid ankyrin) n=1 Tax=Durusdinium trenchii TaxID=1381693 RepID=A0ABP0KIL9_9DINO
MPKTAKAAKAKAAGSGADAAKALRPKAAAAQKAAPRSLGEVEGIPWSGKLGVPKSFEQRSSEIADCAERGVLLEDLQDLAVYAEEVSEASYLTNHKGSAVAWPAVNLYVINDHFVKPFTLPFKCSWVELVSAGPQPPTWFVSHWWGTPFFQTVSLLEFHTQQRLLEKDAPYWICTFANNQHDLSGLSGQLRETPFVKAILSPRCQGTVALLDSEVTTFDRIWCVLENFVSSVWAREEEDHLYDIACWLPANSALHGGKAVPAKPTLRMDTGEGAKESVADEATGGAFPLRVATKGVTVDISQAKASLEEDKQRILHLIAGTPEAEWSSTAPPSECDAFTSMNTRVRKMFAPGALYKAALHNEVPELSKLLTEFPEAKDEGISDGAGPVYAAAMKNHTDALKVLLDAGAQVDKAKHDGATAVFIATQFGSTDALKDLLSARASPDLARREDGVTPSFMAVQNGKIEELTLLLEARADPQQLTTKGAAALHLAVQLDKADVVKVLLEHKADPNLETAQGQRPLSLVKGKKVTKLLQDAGAEVAAPVSAAPTAAAGSSAPLVPKAPPKGKAKAKAKASFAAASANVTQQIGLMGAYELLEQ